jgi:hypothetical protein
MNIPVFVSCPTSLNKEQEASRRIILGELTKFRFEPRALGRSDYPTDLPLREVYVVATHCSGGVILGFEQFQTETGIWKRGTKEQRKASATPFPSSWNHLEAGILYSLGLPVLVFKEDGISGGVFDPGVTDVFVHRMPKSNISKQSKISLSEVFLKWQANVREHYYRDRQRGA